MSWTTGQIKRIHMVKTAAKVTDAEYRNTLFRCCRGAGSAKDAFLENEDFRLANNELMQTLMAKIARGSVQAPKWFDQKPDTGKRATDQQISKCFAIIYELNEVTGESYGRDYILGVARKCSKANTASINSMSRNTARLTIDALTDVLARAHKKAESSHAHAGVDTYANGYPDDW